MERIFTLTVTSTLNHTWQGTVRCGNESADFESELELLRFLSEKIDRCPEERKE